MKCSAVPYKKVEGPGEYSAVGPTLWVTSYFLTARDTPIIDWQMEVQCTVYSVQCAVRKCRVQCAVFSVQFCYVQCAVCSVQSTLFSVQFCCVHTHFRPTNACHLVLRGWWTLQKQHKWYHRFRAFQKYKTLVGSEWTHKLCLTDEIKSLQSLVLKKMCFCRLRARPNIPTNPQICSVPNKFIKSLHS